METTKFTFDAIGTSWVIDVYTLLDSKKKDSVLELINKRIDEFDKNYSRFRDDSLITKISKSPDKYKLPNDAKDVFDVYKKLYKKTDGLFTPLIGNLMEESGYDPTYSLIPKTLHHPPSWEDTVEYDFPYIKLKRESILDIGAAGKGYLIDIIGKLLKKNDINSYCIDAGGDMQIYKYPDKGLRIGLENPNDFSQVIGVITLNNISLCGSAGSRRKWDRFHHIINPKTLSSPSDILATWVTSKNTLVADAIATCLFLVNSEKLKDTYDFEYLILRKDFSIEKSKGFEADLFLS